MYCKRPQMSVSHGEGEDESYYPILCTYPCINLNLNHGRSTTGNR